MDFFDFKLCVYREIIKHIDKRKPPLKYPAPLTSCVNTIDTKNTLFSILILVLKKNSKKNKNIIIEKKPNSVIIFNKLDLASL